MSLFSRLRTLGILLCLCGTLIVLGKSLFFPGPLDRVPPAVQFPTDSPLPGWIPLPREPDPTLPNTARYQSTGAGPVIDLELQFIPDPTVHYVRNPLLELRFLPRGHLPLDAGMHFYLNSRGHVLANLRTDGMIDARVEPHDTAPRSGYAFWEARERLHLSTIVTPGGDSSMDTRRVARSTYVDQATSSRLGPWLIGRAIYPDRRCVLIHFSLPASSAEGRRVLETAWADWQRASPPLFPD